MNSGALTPILTEDAVVDAVCHYLIERGWTDIVGIDKSGIPTDIGSTAHASDFCYMTSHDFLSCWSSLYSIAFYDKLGLRGKAARTGAVGRLLSSG